MKIGDWVSSYSQGVWQIQRVEKIRSEFPDSSTRTLVFLKRLINNKGKRAFSVECCDSSFVRPLDEYQQQTLNKFFTDNPSISEKFEKYERNIDSILNMGLYCDSEEMKSEITELAKKQFKFEKEGITDFQIGEIWKKEFSKYLGSSIRNMTLQFISINTTVIDYKTHYQKLNFLDF